MDHTEKIVFIESEHAVTDENGRYWYETEAGNIMSTTELGDPALYYAKRKLTRTLLLEYKPEALSACFERTEPNRLEIAKDMLVVLVEKSETIASPEEYAYNALYFANALLDAHALNPYKPKEVAKDA